MWPPGWGWEEFMAQPSGKTSAKFKASERLDGKTQKTLKTFRVFQSHIFHDGSFFPFSLWESLVLVRREEVLRRIFNFREIVGWNLTNAFLDRERFCLCLNDDLIEMMHVETKHSNHGILHCYSHISPLSPEVSSNQPAEGLRSSPRLTVKKCARDCVLTHTCLLQNLASVFILTWCLY